MIGFIEQIAPYVKKYAPQYGIKVYSPIIAQAVLESASGTSELAKNAHNYFGLKYRSGRCPTACGIYYKAGSEQNKNGTYTSYTMQWMKFPNMEAGVKGYFDFINHSNYANLKAVTDPKTYLENIKKDGYATSLKYVENLMTVITKYHLTTYDSSCVEVKNTMNLNMKTDFAHRSNYGSSRNTSQIKYIVWHYTANDGDADESNAKYFKTPNREASAHYFVDDDSVTISVPDTYVAWSVGGNRYPNYRSTGGASLYRIATNSNTLNIELCDTVKNGKYDVSQKTLENAIQLTQELMKKYNIPISNVIRHFDVTGKNCPAYFVDNTKWNQIKQRISNSSNPCQSPAAASTTGKYTYQNADYSLVFDPVYYSNQYADLKKAFGTNAADLFHHFCSFGMKEGRIASSNFNVLKYKNYYADLRNAFGNNLPLYFKHYITYGYKENRKCV